MPSQLPLELKHTGRGGYRPGAGRKRGKRPRVMHRVREAIPGRNPVIVTVRGKGYMLAASVESAVTEDPA